MGARGGGACVFKTSQRRRGSHWFQIWLILFYKGYLWSHVVRILGKDHVAPSAGVCMCLIAIEKRTAMQPAPDERSKPNQGVGPHMRVLSVDHNNHV